MSKISLKSILKKTFKKKVKKKTKPKKVKKKVIKPKRILKKKKKKKKKKYLQKKKKKKKNFSIVSILGVFKKTKMSKFNGLTAFSHCIWSCNAPKKISAL